MPNRFSKVDAQQVPLLGGNAKMASDPKRNQTVLHLSTLGAIRGEQNNTFVDDSPNRFSITRTGNVAPSTFSPYGDSWSNYFNGSSDYLSVADNAALEMGSGNFTIEMWINPQSYQTVINADSSIRQTLVRKDSAYHFCLWSSNTTSWGGLALFYYTNQWYTATVVNYAFELNKWYHVAFVRNGSSATFYIDGKAQTPGTMTGTLADTTSSLMIGAIAFTGYLEYFKGNISNLRIVKGTALYTSDFTPSKTPLTAVSGTSLLTCASNRFQDKSSNNFTITPAGNVAVKTASPFPQTREFKKPQRGWCVPFNGSTQRLETPAASVANGLQLGTSDFTIECWVKAKPQSNYAGILDAGVYNNPNYSWLLASPDASASSTGYFAIYTGTGTGYVGVSLPNLFNNSWRHIAIVRKDDILYSYIDGVLQESATIPLGSRNLNYVTPITVGVRKNPLNNSYNNYFTGKISNVMIVKKALYSGNFVPMQSPRTADQNGTLPVLLTCQGGTVMDYSYSSQTLTSAGSLVVDSDGPFDQDDELSYYFDGNGDYLSIADNAALEIGSGDFTIECWFNSAVAAKAQANSDGTYNFVLAEKPASYSFVVQGTSSQWTDFYMGLYNGSTWQTVSAGGYNFQANTWYHIAVSKQSGTMRLFVNGKLLNSGTITHTAANNANALLIGINGVLGTNYAFNGYISNLRLVTGAALYTANFTPSRKPLGIASSGSTALLTCMGRTVADQSNNNLTVSGLGNALYPISEPSPFRQFDTLRTSCYFDGNNDYLQIADNANLKIYNSDFTIEAWVYPASMPTGATTDTNSVSIVSKQLEYMFYYAYTGVLQFQVRNSAGTAWNTYVSSGTLRAGMWNHVAACRAGTSMRIFLNGAQVYSGTWTATTRTTTNAVTVGRNFDVNYSWYLNAYVTGFKISKYCLYGGSYTPGYLLNDYGNQLLLNAYPAIYDTTRKNAIETVGSYAAANAGVVYGKGAERYSAYFTGASDYLTIPYSPDFDFGTGDFTIETWIYIVGNSAVQDDTYRPAGIISGLSSLTQNWVLSIGGSTTTTGAGLYLECKNAGVYAVAGTAFSISQTTWHHVAISRKSGIIRVFLNGIQQGSDQTFTTSISSGGGQIWVGGLNMAGYTRYLNGLLHDLRVTKGVARYTSNFRLPILHPIK